MVGVRNGSRDLLASLNEQWFDDALGAFLLFPLFQQFDGRSQFGGHRLQHDEGTVKARRNVVLHLVIQLFV
jgi:hypothetical protein